MDEIVKQALIKWPNVPHCYGWLALDARGDWRMRDERAQKLGLPGDKIRHPALLGFIARNYGQDEMRRWYFQNGPQRVYVNLDATPYIARTDPQQGFVLQTGESISGPDAAWIGAHGNLILRQGDKLAQVDDRDMAECLANMELDGKAVQDDALLDWIADAAMPGKLTLTTGSAAVEVQRLADENLATHFGFIALPLPD
ncbi:MAG: DUF2946 family protein [Burkholderiaceae bacterium]|nr:DUF2946 family protein [Burkholderiaceae bacterium]